MATHKNKNQIESMKAEIDLAFTDIDIKCIIDNLDTFSEEVISNIAPDTLFFINEIATYYNNIGYLYLEDNLYDESILYLGKSMQLRLRLPFENEYIFECYSTMKQSLLKTYKYDKAIEYTSRLVVYAKKNKCYNQLVILEEDLIFYRKELSKIKK
jgi:tetratricopeptide (TPR) repeat protein